MEKDRLQTDLGLRIKELREVRNESQETFANRIRMDRSYFASVEVGRRNVTLQNLAKIANGFDISLSELFEGITIPEDHSYQPKTRPAASTKTSKPHSKYATVALPRSDGLR